MKRRGDRSAVTGRKPHGLQERSEIRKIIEHAEADVRRFFREREAPKRAAKFLGKALARRNTLASKRLDTQMD